MANQGGQVDYTALDRRRQLIDETLKNSFDTSSAIMGLQKQRADEDQIRQQVGAYASAMRDPKTPIQEKFNKASEATAILSGINHPLAAKAADDINKNFQTWVSTVKAQKPKVLKPTILATDTTFPSGVTHKAGTRVYGYETEDNAGNTIIQPTDAIAPESTSKSSHVKEKGILDEKHGALTVGYDPENSYYTVTEKDGNVRPYDQSKDGEIHLLGEATQTKTSMARGEGYALGRAKYNLKQVVDTKNDNQLTNVSNLDIMKDPTRYVDAATGQKVMSKTALIEDIRGNIKQNREAIDKLDNNFDAGFRSKVAVALRQTDPASALSQMISSIAPSEMTESQLDFLNSLNFLTENAMAMRSVLGAGQGSEDLRNAIIRTLPGVMSPDKKYAQKQLDLFEKTLDRLKKGVPQMQNQTTNQQLAGAGSQKTAPQSALDYLKANDTPEIREHFKNKYGYLP